jgi:hypothetical protein
MAASVLPFDDAAVLGCMERGTTFAYAELAECDGPGPGSFLYWGCFLASSSNDLIELGALNARTCEDLGISVVDHIDEHNVVFKIRDWNDPALINLGPTPCVFSQAEAKPPAQYARWYHFQQPKDRSTLHQALDRFHARLPTSRLFLLLSLLPLRVAYFMTLEETRLL